MPKLSRRELEDKIRESARQAGIMRKVIQDHKEKKAIYDAAMSETVVSSPNSNGVTIPSDRTTPFK